MVLKGKFIKRGECLDLFHGKKIENLRLGSSPCFLAEFRFPIGGNNAYRLTIPAIIDTGAECSVLPGNEVKIYKDINGKVEYELGSPLKNLSPTLKSIKTAGGNVEPCLQFANSFLEIKCLYSNHSYKLENIAVNVLLSIKSKDKDERKYALIGQDILQGFSLIHSRPLNNILISKKHSKSGLRLIKNGLLSCFHK